MCETLAGLRGAMAAYTADFDPAVVCPGRAGQVVAQAGAIEKMAATIKSLAAAWMAQGDNGLYAMKRGACSGGVPLHRSHT